MLNNENETVTINYEKILTNTAKDIITVHVPEGTTHIGDYAFEEVSDSLQAVYLPSSLTKIAPTAWHGCDFIQAIFCDFTKEYWQEITLSAPNVYLPLNCKIYFTDCVMKISESTILFHPKNPETLQAINHYANKIEETNVSELAPYCCEDCWNLKKVSLGSKLHQIKKIGEGTFKNCCSLIDLTLHTNSTVIPRSFMEGCSSIQKLNIPESVFLIEKDAFRECRSLELVSLNNVVCIEDNSFEGCNSLRMVELPKTIKRVSTNAFSNCSNLISITINKEVQSISDSFRGSPISEIIFTGTRPQFTRKFGRGFMTISPEAMIVCNDGILQNGELQIKNNELIAINELVDEIEVPEGVTVIHPCFYNRNVKKIILPSTTKELGDQLWLGKIDIEVFYNGTIAEWERVKKDLTFFDPYEITKPGEYTKIFCLDGELKEFYRKPYDGIDCESECEQVDTL